MNAVTEAALEAIAVEQRPKKLKILFHAVVRRCRHPQELPRETGQQPSEVIRLREFDLASRTTWPTCCAPRRRQRDPIGLPALSSFRSPSYPRCARGCPGGRGTKNQLAVGQPPACRWSGSRNSAGIGHTPRPAIRQRGCRARSITRVRHWLLGSSCAPPERGSSGPVWIPRLDCAHPGAERIVLVRIEENPPVPIARSCSWNGVASRPSYPTHRFAVHSTSEAV